MRLRGRYMWALVFNHDKREGDVAAVTVTAAHPVGGGEPVQMPGHLPLMWASKVTAERVAREKNEPLAEPLWTVVPITLQVGHA